MTIKQSHLNELTNEEKSGIDLRPAMVFFALSGVATGLIVASADRVVGLLMKIFIGG
jgi:hypothetical protein